MKSRLEKTFGNSILFFTAEYHSIQVVISRSSLHEQSLSSLVDHFEQSILSKAADIIRPVVLEKVTESSEINWPPTVGQLNDRSRDPIHLLENIYRHVLVGDPHHTLSEHKQRIVSSFSEDVVYSATRSHPPNRWCKPGD